LGSKDSAYAADRELAERALRGEEEATAEVTRMVSELSSLALTKLEARGVPIPDRENVSGEVRFLVLVKDPASTLGRYRGESALRTFLWQVVRHKVIDLLRSQKHGPSAPLEDAGAIPFLPPADHYRDIVRCLFEYLDAQPRAVRLVLEGRWIQELSYKEIAERARDELEETLTTEAIGSLLFEHRKKFRKRLESLGLRSD